MGPYPVVGPERIKALVVDGAFRLFTLLGAFYEDDAGGPWPSYGYDPVADEVRALPAPGPHLIPLREFLDTTAVQSHEREMGRTDSAAAGIPRLWAAYDHILQCHLAVFSVRDAAKASGVALWVAPNLERTIPTPGG